MKNIYLIILYIGRVSWPSSIHPKGLKVWGDNYWESGSVHTKFQSLWMILERSTYPLKGINNTMRIVQINVPSVTENSCKNEKSYFHQIFFLIVSGNFFLSFGTDI